MSGSWAEETQAALRAQGLRSGGARRAVIETLAVQDCCLTAQDIFDRLRVGEQGRGASIASVYRILDLLASQGFVQRIELGSGIARYEPVSRDGEHHHHLVCDGCGKIEAFDDAALERVLSDVEERSGYAIAGHDVVLHGTCGDCRS